MRLLATEWSALRTRSCRSGIHEVRHYGLRGSMVHSCHREEGVREGNSTIDWEGGLREVEGNQALPPPYKVLPGRPKKKIGGRNREKYLRGLPVQE
ncbi:hypothetical protein LINPERHAP1_LOCUS8266 [Linum perenne]